MILFVVIPFHLSLWYQLDFDKTLECNLLRDKLTSFHLLAHPSNAILA